MHSFIPELTEQFQKGKISRREFMRMATLLGLSVSTASVLAACTSEEAATPTTTSQSEPTTAPAAESTAAPTAASTEAPGEEPAKVPTEVPAAGTPKRGGEITLSEGLLRFDDPHVSLMTEYNVFRNVAEHLVQVGPDNITRPWLLESWEASDDLLTWTLKIRQGIMFNHGPELTAEDVAYNLNRWIDPDVGSSMVGLFGEYLTPEGIEVVDDYTVVLHLETPQMAVPEHMFHNQAVILPKDFDGNWLENPTGTGPFTLEEYLVEERALLQKREGYWREGADGEPLPYLDSVRFIYLSDTAAEVAALSSGQVDIAGIDANQVAVLEDAGVLFSSQTSSYTHVFRMRCDQGALADKRLRNAIKACQGREAILEATNRGFGSVGADHHVAPIHPAYCPEDPIPQDYDKARALLEEAGVPDGFTVDLACIDQEPFLTLAQMLKAQCEPAGIIININTMPSSLYWEQWMDVDFGITSWMHRPLATMTMTLAYKSGASWNETHFSNERFDELLVQAEGTLDVEARRELYCEMQQILREEGGIAVPRFNALIYAYTPRVQDFAAAPHDHMLITEVWVDDDAA